MEPEGVEKRLGENKYFPVCGSSSRGKGKPRAEELDLISELFCLAFLGSNTEDWPGIILGQKGCDKGTGRFRGPPDVDLSLESGEHGYDMVKLFYHPW
jgi:hypothetical protein